MQIQSLYTTTLHVYILNEKQNPVLKKTAYISAYLMKCFTWDHNWNIWAAMEQTKIQNEKKSSCFDRLMSFQFKL